MSDPLPPRQRWSGAPIADPAELCSLAAPLLRRGEPIMLIGGRLAAALAAPLRAAGFQLVATEKRHPLLAELPPEADEYEAFGNGYGEVHSARAFRQLVERAARTFAPREDRWPEDGQVVDPFRPALRYPAASDREFDVLTERHLNTVRSALRRAGTLVVALSTAEVWEAREDGAVYPHWQGAGGRFDPARHAVRTLTVEETAADLDLAIAAARAFNPGVGVILMVSPEPQRATAQPVHVRVADALGKAVLRIAVEAAARTEGVRVFPALEIAALSSPAGSYGADGALPDAAVAAVVEALLAVSEGGRAQADGVGAPVPVPVLSAAPVQPERVEAPPAATLPKLGEQPGAKPKRRPAKAPVSPATKTANVAVIDAFTVAKAAEEREKEAARAAKRADAKARAEEATQAAERKEQALAAEREEQARAVERAKLDAEDDAKLQAKKVAREARRAERAGKRGEAARDGQAGGAPAATGPIPGATSRPDERPADEQRGAAMKAKRAARRAKGTPETGGGGERRKRSAKDDPAKPGKARGGRRRAVAAGSDAAPESATE